MWLRYFIIMVSVFYLSFASAAPELQVVEQKISDSVISTKISAKLTKKGLINPLKMQFSTKQGVVTLRGYVKDKQAFVDVLRIVKTTKGVKAVDTEALFVKPINTPITDAYITAKVEAAILRAKVFDDESIPLVGIQAKTNNGKVVLSGMVKKSSSISFIVKRVHAVRGVKAVESHLTVLASN